MDSNHLHSSGYALHSSSEGKEEHWNTEGNLVGDFVAGTTTIASEIAGRFVGEIELDVVGEYEVGIRVGGGWVVVEVVEGN